MKKSLKYKTIIIILLILVMIGLSLGFAAFAKELNVIFTDTNVRVSGNLDIKFLVSPDINNTDTIIKPYLDGIASFPMYANNATILMDGLTVSGIGGIFTDKGQLISYEFYVYNNSEYDAYLKSIDFLNNNNNNENKVCKALEGTTQSLVDNACEDIHVGVSIDVGNGFVEIFDTDINDFASVKIGKGEIGSFIMGIVYDNGSIGLSDETALLPNGDFKINFGDIKFNFSSLEG